MATMVSSPLEVAENVGMRLAAATHAHRDAQEIAMVASKLWRELVVEALDSGMRQRDIAHVAGVSTARVHNIIVGESMRG